MRRKRVPGAKPRRRFRREASAGGVVYHLFQGEPRFLLIRDTHGNWGFPKGHIESGEDPEAAAVREVREEAGVDPVTLKDSIAAIEWTFSWRGDLIRKRCTYFLMEASSDRTAPQLDEGIVECSWMDGPAAERSIPYENARGVLRRANAMIGTVRA